MEVPKPKVAQAQIASSSATHPPLVPTVKVRLVITARNSSEAIAKAKQLVSDRSANIRQFGLSKYIGETEKNLELVFANAQQTNAVLLFDEADALFGKRTSVKDAHNRFSNPPFSTLAEQIRAYRGTVIIASAQPALLDPDLLRKYAFVRPPHP